MTTEADAVTAVYEALIRDLTGHQREFFEFLHEQVCCSSHASDVQLILGSVKIYYQATKFSNEVLSELCKGLNKPDDLYYILYKGFWED